MFQIKWIEVANRSTPTSFKVKEIAGRAESRVCAAY